MPTPQSTNKIVLCTGANQGLGFAILQVAGLQEPSSVFILASRNLESGQAAARQLAADGVKDIDVVQLDVTNDEQIIEAVKFVEEKYGKLDVLINNAGILKMAPDQSLATLRQTYNAMLNTNLTSVAVVSTTFLPLLHRAANPRVINVTSGLGSIQNTLTKKMGRYPPYGASKVGMNGVTAHMQTAENDRIAAEEEAEGRAQEEGRIRFYSVAPGVCKTSFTDYKFLYAFDERSPMTENKTQNASIN
ncbi:hypothetical protein FQN50_000169 [Emmonsiellopsis sp. PD_5]|nr:hypothetical protein FQN50_000169 [Emmonsiellopsis sp. PD_5]